MGRIGLAALVGLGIAGAVSAQLGMDDGDGAPAVAAPKGAEVEGAVAPVGPSRGLRVPGFDPQRDVASVQNTWSNGRCFGISTLTAMVWMKVRFQASGGVPLDAWRAAAKPKPPLLLDRDGIRVLGKWLASGKPGKLTVAGYASLRDLTRGASAGAEAFTAWCEPTQVQMQDWTEGGRFPDGVEADAAGGMNLEAVADLRSILGVGHLATLGLKRVKGATGGGHRVLAYGLNDRGRDVEIVCHDPNLVGPGRIPELVVRVTKADGALEVWKRTYDATGIAQLESMDGYDFGFICASDPAEEHDQGAFAAAQGFGTAWQSFFPWHLPQEAVGK